MTRQRSLLSYPLIAGIFIGLSLLIPPLAQANLLTRAEVYKLLNQVQLLPYRQSPRSAKLADELVPRDALRTGTRSRVELLFNEGSLARIGSNAIFRFVRGTRSFQLRNGNILAMIPSGQGMTRIVTPEAITAARGTALLVQHDSTKNTTLVGALTNNLAGSILVSNHDGEDTVRLRAGQRVSVVDGVVGSVEDFDLQEFYQACDIAAGLAPGQEQLVTQESPKVQETLNIIRAETAAALAEQSSQSEARSADADSSSLCAEVSAVEEIEEPRRPRPTITLPFPFPFPFPPSRSPTPESPREPNRPVPQVEPRSPVID